MIAFADGCRSMPGFGIVEFARIGSRSAGTTKGIEGATRSLFIPISPDGDLALS